MNMDLFLVMVESVAQHDIYLRDMVNGLGQVCAFGIQKCLDAIWILAYGVCDEFLNECVTIG